MRTPSEQFPRAVDGLPQARPPETVELTAGGRFDLRIAPVANRKGAGGLHGGQVLPYCSFALPMQASFAGPANAPHFSSATL